MRKEELEAKKLALIKEMATETDNVFKKVKEFKKEIKANLKSGLIKLDGAEKNWRKEIISKSWASMLPKRGSVSVTPKSDVPVEEEAPYVIPKYISLEWLANECEWETKKLDPEQVVLVFQRIDQLRNQYEAMDKMTLVINKRQALLGVPKSDFHDLKEIQDDLKPLYDLWSMVDRYATTLPKWIENPLDQIEAA